MTRLSFTARGEPLGTARPRVTRNGTFTPKASRDAQERIGAAFLVMYPRHRPTTGEIALTVDFHRATGYRRDIDNLAKTVLDGLNGLLYVDDYQVTELRLRVHLGVPKIEARTDVTCDYEPKG